MEPKLDADVALSVVKTFTEAVRARAVGVEVTKSLTPGQAFIKVVHEELTRLMGEPSGGLNLRDASQVLAAILRYNNSMSYAQNVLGWAAAYATGVVPVEAKGEPAIGVSAPVEASME